MALSNGIALALKTETLEIVQAENLKKAGEVCRDTRFDLILLDVNLPDGSGFEFLRERKEKSDTPIILLTANDLEIDIVAGLELGADDYVTKPFSLAVLRARVNTQLRKQNSPGRHIYEQGGFSFDFERMEFRRGGELLELSRTEQKLLRLLVENRGVVLERSVLVDRIWTDGAEYVDENALSVTIKRLRDKLEVNPSTPCRIKTVYGVGYVWEAK